MDRERLLAMRDMVAHRGPDDAGLYLSPDRRVGLGFRRLSIIDLSAGGHQPMASDDEAVWLMFNGELYNFVELRAELEARGYAFRSRSDTEVVLRAYQAWGEQCVGKFIGMFAFVIWDQRAQSVFAARDRLGIKPLYYSATPERVLFASELKPIIAAPGFEKTLDPAGLRDYLTRGYISAPRTIFRDARSLEPGHTLSWSFSAARPVIRSYWNPLDFYVAEDGRTPRTEDDWADELDELLRSAVRSELVSDVPLGVFLSGGVDSSLVAALVRQASAGEVRTFTVGFHESAYNEAPFASALGQHLGTTHAQLTVTEQEAQQVVPLLADYYDEPFADSSQIPTYLVSRMTRQHVTVALSGDGGDEMFCGYAHYQRMARWERAWRLPQWIRAAAGRSAALVGDERIRLAARGLALPDPLAFADYFLSVWRPHEIAELVPDLRGFHLSEHAPHQESLRNGPAMPLLDRMMLIDLQQYLPNDILTKVDRASMAVSLETRVPLLDHRLVEFSLRLPLHLKRRNGTGKYLLRQILFRYVPQALVDRPKQGFGVPLDRWLRQPLRGLLEHYLDPALLETQNVFQPGVVRRHLQRFLAGECSHARVWSLLMFQMWASRYGLKSLAL